MSIKTLTMLIVFTTSFSYAAVSPAYTYLVLAAIDNKSSEHVTVTDGTKDEQVGPTQRKFLRRRFLIPFVSIKEHQEEFLHDEPYIPARALLVGAGHNKFAVWEDETGILFAFPYEKGVRSRADCLPRKLFEAINAKAEHDAHIHWARLLSFLLIIDGQGEPHLEEVARR